MTQTLYADTRKISQKSQLKKIRREGKIPAVVYGVDVGSVPVAVSEKELNLLLRDDPNVIIHMEIPDKGTKKVIVNDIQRDKLYRDILHIDFWQLNMSQEMTASVRLNWTGEPIGVKQEGGIFQAEHHEVEVQCLPENIPSQIEVDISELTIGDTIKIADLSVPEGVALLAEEELALASVLPPQKVEEETADEVEKEPEVISEAQGTEEAQESE